MKGAYYQFGRVPTRMVSNGGVLAAMSAGALRVYVILCANNNNAFDTRPSVGAMADILQCCERTVQRSLRELEKLRMIALKVGGGRGLTNVYTILDIPEKDDIQAVTISDKRVTDSEITVTRKSQNGDIRSVTPSESDECQKQKPPMASATTESFRAGSEEDRPEIDHEVNNILAAAGIGNPKRRELACNRSLTAEITRKVIAKAQSMGKPTALIIMGLQDAADVNHASMVQSTANEDAARAADAGRDAARMRDRELRDRDAERHVQWQIRLDALDDAELQSLKEAAIIEHPVSRQIWRQSDPRKPCRGLFIAMSRILESLPLEVTS